LLNHFWIGAAAFDANRDTLYFGGARVGADVFKVLAWPVAWAAILAVPIYLRKCRLPHRAETSAAVVLHATSSRVRAARSSVG
jgi:hypothetical protein